MNKFVCGKAVTVGHHRLGHWFLPFILHQNHQRVFLKCKRLSPLPEIDSDNLGKIQDSVLVTALLVDHSGFGDSNFYNSEFHNNSIFKAGPI